MCACVFVFKHVSVINGVMTLNEVREKYLQFFKDKGHTVLPSAPLVPHNDPSTLFIGSGMQPLVPYLLGQAHPAGVRVTNSQKCFRSEDIDEVGDNRHTTFFEMLGNWSFGDYWKEEQLQWYFDFLTQEMKLDPSRLYVTCFLGDEASGISRDDESAEIWKRLFKASGIDAQAVVIGSEEDGSKKGLQEGRIFYYDASKNWWSRSGTPARMPVGEIGGPDSEVFYDFGTQHDVRFGEHCHVNCDCGRFVELGNSVFMEYQKASEGVFNPLPKKNVDFGGGLSRIASATTGESDIFSSAPFSEIIAKGEALSGVKYRQSPETDRAFRIIADHMCASVMMIADGVLPSNTEAGYILRRLLRRAIHFADTTLSFPEGGVAELIPVVMDFYQDVYPEVKEGRSKITEEIALEYERFKKTLGKGLREFSKGERDSFVLFTTYGFPYEMTEELAREQGEEVDHGEFLEKMKDHKDLSRQAAQGKFKGGLADSSDEVIKLHTAHHLLLGALQRILGTEVKQRGSNITKDRLRIDFSFERKLSDEEKKQAEDMVNQWIQDDLAVVRREMPRVEAEQMGAEMEFGAKYGERVSVYFIEDADGNAISKEFCGGPHVERTGGLGTFAIQKEESSSNGVRRIKATLS